jgi:hypothetical protein
MGRTRFIPLSPTERYVSTCRDMRAIALAAIASIYPKKIVCSS